MWAAHSMTMKGLLSTWDGLVEALFCDVSKISSNKSGK